MKKFFLTYSVFPLIITSILSGGITGKINGYVTNQNGEPLPGANIILEGTNRGAAADQSGYYVILNIFAPNFPSWTE